MKVKLKLISFLVFSLLLMGATSYQSYAYSNNFNVIEKGMVSECMFIQNGVKMEYYSKLSLEEEYDRISKYFETHKYYDVKLEDSTIIYKSNDKEIYITLWNEKLESKVEIIYLNNLQDKSSFKIEEEVSKFKNNDSNRIKYSRFIKVKVEAKNKEYLTNLLHDNFSNDTIETLETYNGQIAKGKLRDNQKVNLGCMRYNTGEYLIIGTPVIFNTY